MNVVLIGESGVGKSSWINAFANYSLYDSLEKAVNDGGFFPIPSTFTVTDPRIGTQINISSEGHVDLSSTQITCTKAGESVTQNANEYIFRRGNTAINLIDTPGLLDTRDAGKNSHDTDEEHLDNILKLLSKYQEIHAIFILIKANVTRLSDGFQYTLTEIFKRLDKSACNNVIFILTNAASTNFKTDATQPILQRFLKNNNLSIALPPAKPTIYCFENSTVKYLVECKNKIPHDDDDKEDAEKSWERSVRSTQDLFGYLCSLKPHSLAVMVSINDAINMVYMISKLALDTMVCIYKDQNEIEDKKSEAERLKQEIMRNPRSFATDALNRLLHITETKVVYEPLGYTNVVCESGKCSTVGAIINPKICCRACKCSGFLMYFCSRMSWQETCKACGCRKRKHTWRTTETKVVTETVYRPDSAVIDQIVDSNAALKQINEGISQFENRIKECKDEKAKMLDICAKLNAFAHQNALVGALSADDGLLECLENERETYAKSTDTRMQANYLAELKSEYKESFSKAKECRYGVEDVPRLIEQLYRLPMKGHDIKMAVDKYEISRRTVIEEINKSKKNFTFNRVSSIASYFS